MITLLPLTVVLGAVGGLGFYAASTEIGVDSLKMLRPNMFLD